MKRVIRSLPLVTGGLVALLLSSLATGGCGRSSGHTARATNIVEITAANFQSEVLASTKPVLVDFWAGWCPPCKALAPIIDEVARDYDGRVKVASVDVDAASALAQRYEIRAIPTVLMFRGGKVVDQFTGLRSKSEIQRQLDTLLAESGSSASTNAATR
jgi:thioredoxin 1